MNSLTDHKLIQALYAASRVGVKIDLVVRGVCILRPGVRGVSENIRVISVIDKFLEHSRIFYFRNRMNSKIFLGSCDLMPRNMDRRVEIVWPVEAEPLKAKIIEIIAASLRDNVKAHVMKSDGSYSQTQVVRQKAFRSQERLIEFARTEKAQPNRLRDALRQLESSAEREDAGQDDIPRLRVSK